MQTAAPERHAPRVTRPMRLAYEYAGFYAALLYFGVVGTLFTCLCALVHPLLPRRIGARVGRSTISFLFRTYLAMLQSIGLLRLDLRALDCLSAERGIVIAPNHPCLLDAVLVIARVPHVGCIMKAAIWDSIVLGGGARLAGYIRNDSPRGMVRRAAASLRAGENLLAFPEGTRTTGTGVNPLRGGFALSAKQARAPVQTVFIETNSAFLGKGWPLLRKPDFPLVYRARLGQRFQVDGDVQAFLTRLEAYYRQELRRPSLDPHHS